MGFGNEETERWTALQSDNERLREALDRIARRCGIDPGNLSAKQLAAEIAAMATAALEQPT